MAILVGKQTKLLVQGITGSQGAFHAKQCMDYGTNVELGRKMLAESGLNVTPAATMGEGAQKIVQSVKGA